jgi:mRNA interferase RelE/StbE
VKTILYTSAALRERRKLDRRNWVRIEAKLRRYAETGDGDVISLSEREGARLKVGDWRVLFTEDAQTIAVYKIGHRRDVYD